jgi:phasin family protein
MAKTNVSVTDANTTFAKMMGEFPFAGFNFDAVLDGQRRNWAALVDANKVWAEGAQTLATRQIEVARQAMEDLSELRQDTMRKPGAFEEQVSKGAACTRHALEGICDIADHAAKSNREVMKLFNQRMSEMLDDARTIVTRAPQASSAHAAD